jgi:hypothetical protein
MNGHTCHAEVNEGGNGHKKFTGKFPLSKKPAGRKVQTMKPDNLRTALSFIC